MIERHTSFAQREIHALREPTKGEIFYVAEKDF
jgi:hypothetical protein